MHVAIGVGAQEGFGIAAAVVDTVTPTKRGTITQAAIQCQHASTPFGDTGAMKRPRHPPSRGRYPQLVRTERCETAERTDTRSHGLIGHGRHDAKHGSHGPSIAACFIAPRPFRPG